MIAKRRLALICFVIPWLLIWIGAKGKVTGPLTSAGIPVSAEPFQKPWTTNRVVLIGLGDSITAGFGATEKRAYFDLLLQNDDAAYPDMKGRQLPQVLPLLESRNLSVSYTISAQHLKLQVPKIPAYPSDVPGIVVITTGGNDLIHDYGRSEPRDGALYGCTAAQGEKWKELFRARLRGILDQTTAKFPGGCDIFLANIYDPTDGVGDIHNAPLPLPPWPDGLKVHAMFNQVIADACRQHTNVHLVDIHTPFLGHGIHYKDKRNKHHHRDDPSYWYYENLEDPNDRGYDAIRRLFLLKMAEVLRCE